MTDLAYIIEKIEAAGYHVNRAPQGIPHPSDVNHGGFEITQPGRGVVAGLLYDFTPADLEAWAREKGLL